MFFYIGSECPVQALKQVAPKLFLDHGWKQKNEIWYKGYSTEVNIEHALFEIVNGYKPIGKWIVIQNNKLFYPEFRGFPLYQKNENLTNVCLQDYESVTYECKATVTDATISLNDATHAIQKILIENTENFLKYNNVDKINVLFSAGLDTLTSWTILDSITDNYNLHIYLPKIEDTTLFKRLGRIREYNNDLTNILDDKWWGYSISSLQHNLNWYITGFYAEVLTYRDAAAIQAIANYYEKEIDDFAEEKDYLYWFLKRPTLEPFKRNKIKFTDENSLKKYLWNTIFYDFQMWHIDNNMTFNPFFDIRIPQIMHQLSIDDLKSNCLNGVIQKNIVTNIKPPFLKLLSNYKNEKNIWNNFKLNYPFIKKNISPNVQILMR